MRKMPPLNALKAFEASARHLNFRLAADELSVTQGAVAQHVRGLEAVFQVKLFERHARGLRLTDEGRRYLPPIGRAFDMIAEATENLSPQDAVITLSSTPSFATRWLVPRLGDFAQTHPDIRIHIDASNALANFQTDDVDIAIRQGKPPFGPGLVHTPLFPSDLIVACHPDLTIGPNALTAPGDLGRHVLLEDSHGQWPLLLDQAFGGQPPKHIKTMHFSQTSMAIDAALARQGVVLTPRVFIVADLAADRLCQPFDLSLKTEGGFHIVSPRTPRNAPRVAAIRDWFIAQADSAGV